MSLNKMRWAYDQTLPSNIKFTLVTMADATSDEGYCWLSNERLAEKIGCDIRTIQRHKRELEQIGVIVDTGMRDQKTGQIKLHHLPCTADGEVELTMGKEVDFSVDKVGGDNMPPVTPVVKRGDTRGQKGRHPCHPNTKNTKNSNNIYKAHPQDIETVQAFFDEKGQPAEMAHDYYDFYESKGWLVGKAPMKDWQAAARRWIKNNSNYTQPRSNGQSRPKSKMQRAIAAMQRANA